MFPIIASSVRTLVGCQALPNTVIAEIFTAAGISGSHPEAIRALAHVGETAISFLIASIGAKKNVSQDIMANLTAPVMDVNYQEFVARRSGIEAFLERDFSDGRVGFIQLSLALNALIGAVWQATQNLEDVARAIMRLGIVDANRDGLDLMAGFEKDLCARSYMSIPLETATRGSDAAAARNNIDEASLFHPDFEGVERVMDPVLDPGMYFQASCLPFNNPGSITVVM